MNHHLSPAKTALTVGVFVGALHVVWSALVALGWAQALVDFKLRMHMVSMPVVVSAFDLSTAVMLVVVATIAGYIVGNIFARVWNRMHGE